MKKKSALVIVESPTKANTITKILGKDFSVVSCMGHLIDLPQKELGVDIEDGFKPHYAVIPGRQKFLTQIKKEAEGKKNIYIATDPDREGEAIGWHIRDKLTPKKKVLRVVFHEITTQAVVSAFKNPRDFDTYMIEAQASRRILDRIVGYLLSPLLWRKIARGLSAGRVQSVALKLIIEREKEIKNFVPCEYWQLKAELAKLQSKNRFAPFRAKLEKKEDKEIKIENKSEADNIIRDLKDKAFFVSEIKNSEKKRYSPAPFITSTLQQEAFNKLKFNATKTMIIAQQLYEGLELGEGGPAGLITYMRTDSTHVAPEAISEVRSLIAKKFGKEYLPASPNLYKTRKHAQEAHEAVRPTLISRAPETLKPYLTPEQYRLYTLIYNRFVASQMLPAIYAVTSVDIKAGIYLFVASGSTLIFAGFTALYNNEDKEDNNEKNIIPPLEKNEALSLIALVPSQHFTKPAPRFSDSSLVKALEEEGIGRPSTYAPIIHTLILRNYVRRLKGYFTPTELGFKVCDMLVEYFPKIMDVKFTAALEDELDEIEAGNLDRIKVLQDFYAPFKADFDFAQTHIKKEIEWTDEVCDKCGQPMIVKWGRKGKFLSCSAYPACKNSKSITTQVKCPLSGCGGELIERRSRRGFFYGCSNFPRCTFTSRTLPQENKPEE